MTATLTTPSFLGACVKPWCLAESNCTREEGEGNLRLHMGRGSAAKGAFRGGKLYVTPYEQDFPNGVTCTGPQVEITMDTLGQLSVELDPATAGKFAASLASFAAEMVEVGETATFEGSATPDELSGVTVTIKRLSDTVFEYGNGAPRYGSFGAVEVAIQDGDGKPDVIGLDAPTAAYFARCVDAVAREVTR